MSKSNLRAVDPEHDKEPEPIANDRHTRVPLIEKPKGTARPLDVDEVLKRAEPDHLGKK